MDDLEAQVTAFVAAQREGQSVTPASRLFEDLRLDGDEAVGFFEAFAARFRTDLAPLHSHWAAHFRPKEPPAGRALRRVATVVGLLAVALGMVYFGAHPGWAWAGSTVGMALLVWGRWRRGPKRVAITVGDLVEAARTGRWAMAYERL